MIAPSPERKKDPESRKKKRLKTAVTRDIFRFNMKKNDSSLMERLPIMQMEEHPEFQINCKTPS